MTYSESAHGQTITYERAMRELARHRCNSPEDIEQFHRDCGKRSQYSATAVLQWLGY